MDLALEMTQTAAGVYELVSDVADSLAATPQEPERPPFRRQLEQLRGITAEIENLEGQVRFLECRTAGARPQTLELFLQDCRAALETFRDVGGRLAGILEPGGGKDPSATVVETLLLIMERLENSSEKVLGLPGTGLAVSSQCLAETAFNLQTRAGKLVVESAGLS